jgi:alpha-N-arabinofuranosidase
MQSEMFNYVFGITKKEKDFFVVLQKNSKGQSLILATSKIDTRNPVQLQVKADGDNYEFSYSTNDTDFMNLGGIVSGDILSTNVAGGFTGSLIGLYATSANDAIPVQ